MQLIFLQWRNYSEMSVVLCTVLILLVLKLVHFWYKLYEKKRKLDWLPHAPGWPFLGVILELGKTSGILFIPLTDS